MIINGQSNRRAPLLGLLVALGMVASLYGESDPLNKGGVEPEAGKPAGTIKGVVKFKGEQKTPKVLRKVLSSSDAVCVKHYKDKEPPRSEAYIFGDNDTLQNVVVYVSKGLEGKDIPKLTRPAVLRQRGCTYRPHVFAVQSGQKLEIYNEDNTMHNVKFASRRNGEFNKTQPKSVIIEQEFKKEEIGARFDCNVHTWMNARMCVFDHPFFAVTQKDGTFEIYGLDPGSYELKAWQPFRFFASTEKTYKVTVEADGEAEVEITVGVKPKKKKK